jgi:hypothetical protein
MPDYQITCHGCGKPLHVPAAAAGKTGYCPYCQAAFLLPVNPDGTPGPPRPVRRWPGVPRPLVIPGFGLLMLGLAGTLVNGYLAARLSLEPGFDLNYARGRVREVRSIEAMSGGTRPSDDWPHAPLAAAAGAAAATDRADRADEELAAAWAPATRPVHAASAAVSLVELLGGIAILRGRWYPLALVGCVAAAVNVNHLCCLPGAVAGLWGLAALARDDVRAFFKRG